MSNFRPAWWLPSAHLQTVGARLTRSARGVPLCRERVELPDGDFVDVDFVDGGTTDRRTDGPLCLVLHGLEGSAQSKYALQTYGELAQRGVTGVGLNFRSCSGELNRTARLYHSGETEDLRFVVGWLRERFPGRPLAAIGFSLGGNVLLKYLGEEGGEGQGGRGAGRQEAPFVAAAAISVPYDLSAGADHLESGFARVYVWKLLRSLKRKVRAKADLVRPYVDYERAVRAATFREFDDAATAPLHGFDGAEDYYLRSSSNGFLHTVAIPTRLIHAADDTFLPASAMPRGAVALNPMLEACFTDRGGHVGFVEGNPWSRRYWAEAIACEFVARHVTGMADVD